MIDHLRKTWGITHEGTFDRFLGIHFERSQDKWSWSATIGTYIDKIVKRFGLEESRKFTTSLEPGFALTVEDFAEEPTESMITEMRSLIGSIGYCAIAVRFDISHAVSVLSRHLARLCTKVIEAKYYQVPCGNAGFRRQVDVVCSGRGAGICQCDHRSGGRLICDGYYNAKIS